MERFEQSEAQSKSSEHLALPVPDFNVTSFKQSSNIESRSNSISTDLPDVGFTDSTARSAISPKAAQLPENLCQPNQDYLKLVDKAIRNYYDPSVLGDPNSLKTKFGCEVKNSSDAVTYAGRAVKEFGDIYTKVIPPAKTALNDHERKGEMGAIGVRLGRMPQDSPTDFGPVEVKEVLEDTPAEKMGLQKGDVVTHVNGANLATLSYTETIGRVRGPVGKPVELTVQRDGQTIELSVNREKREISNVKEERLDGNIGYVRLKNFSQDDTVEDVKEALEKHSDASAFVIDMRNNLGGQFKLGYQLASLFMDQGLLLKTRRRIDSDPSNPQYRSSEFVLTPKEIEINSRGETNNDLKQYKLKRFDDIVDKPFVVLVNGKTSSSAEIFAGAIQADDEGLVMGSQTDGKGIGQTIYRGMPGGSSIKVTTFRIYRPDGTWTGDDQKTENGIIPDLVVENPVGTKFGSAADIQLNAATTYLKSITKEPDKKSS